jgi:hypothetical protein
LAAARVSAFETLDLGAHLGAELSVEVRKRLARRNAVGSRASARATQDSGVGAVSTLSRRVASIEF